MRHPMEFNFSGRRAAILHPSENVRELFAARLATLGVTAFGEWPEAEEILSSSDFLLVDIDMGYDKQIPWEPGCAPIPVIGLVRSESPGRLAWALQQKLDAFLPQEAPGLIYSTLVVAAAKAAERQEQILRDAEIARRAGLRHVLIHAVLFLMQNEGIDAFAALKRLRAFAMVERLPLEDAAALLLDGTDDLRVEQQK